MRYVRVLTMSLIVACIFLVAVVMGQKNVYKATVDKDGIQKVNVLAGSYFFDPDYIIVMIDVPVEITIKREPGLTPHDIVIRAPEAGIDISESLSTEPKIITFTPKKVGKYPFYCTKNFLFFKSHRERGMEGIIEVID